MADPYPAGVGEAVVPATCRVGPNAYALRVQGGSMEPVFPNGSVIIGEPALDKAQTLLCNSKCKAKNSSVRRWSGA